ncbi:MAG: transcriptional regulator [Candidatus Odinarchaeota archaeon]|nr:transcriptional regulator [Candidatus Odinarchaeota archaeon]
MHDINESDIFKRCTVDDTLLRAPARAGIMLLLYLHQGATFKQLIEATGLTAGNLVSHIKKLEAKGYVKVVKFFEELKPRTKYEITEKGKRAFEEYAKFLSDFLELLKTKQNTTNE